MRIKCERYIFIKKCVRSFIVVRKSMLWLWLYNIYPAGKHQVLWETLLYITFFMYFCSWWLMTGCLQVGKMFNQITTLQGLILALVYPWYANTKYIGRKDKINTFVHTKKILHFIYTIYLQVVLKGKNIQTCPRSKTIHILFHEQAVYRKRLTW